MPLDLDGKSTLAELMLSAAVSQQLKANSANYVVPRSKIIRLLGQLDISKTSLFSTIAVDQDIPKGCHLKSVAERKVTLRKAKVRTYEDICVAKTPYLVCCIPNLSTMPIQIDEDNFISQMKAYRMPDTSDSTTTRNQLCAWGAYITAFHRDTMFSRKVHTFSPGSMKLWCFEKKMGQLDLLDLLKMKDSQMQMRTVTSDPTSFFFFLQKPGEIVEHMGGYAHFVMTFNRYDSPYGQWCALIGWEVNTPRQINQSMRIEASLVQGKNGTLDEVSDATFLKACASTTHISYSVLKRQGSVHQDFLDMQNEKSRRRVELLDKAKARKLSKYAGLRNRASSSDHLRSNL
jgi:hypothetical protein